VDLRPGYGIRLVSAAKLLHEHTAVAADDREWSTGPVHLAAYLGAASLPAEIPGRVRVLVNDGDRVLVTWDRFGRPDCFPGGGIEPGESILDAACREVWEETGWHLDRASIVEIGWIHVESTSPPASNFPFPHPDTFMTVVIARPQPRADVPSGWIDVEGFIQRSAFVALSDLPLEVRTDPIAAAFLRTLFASS